MSFRLWKNRPHKTFDQPQKIESEHQKTFLHVGGAKCASTFIQHLLAAHNGVHYAGPCQIFENENPHSGMINALGWSQYWSASRDQEIFQSSSPLELLGGNFPAKDKAWVISSEAIMFLGGKQMVWMAPAPGI